MIDPKTLEPLLKGLVKDGAKKAAPPIKFTVPANSPEGKRLKHLFSILQTAEMRKKTGLLIPMRDDNENAARLMVDELRQVLRAEGKDVSELDKVLDGGGTFNTLDVLKGVTQSPDLMKSFLTGMASNLNPADIPLPE